MTFETFYLGTHLPHWLGTVNVPLFISRRRLQHRKTFPRAKAPWAMDSGGFTEIAKFGKWEMTPRQYVAIINRCATEIGNLEWAAPMDWMCEPSMLERSGRTIAEHQRFTVESVLELRQANPNVPIIPVLQGWLADDYCRHVETYQQAGIDLENEPVVGLGSICRRQATAEAMNIAMRLQPIRLHAFGAKTDALRTYGSMLRSADSLSWSFAGRKQPDPHCRLTSCSNCLHYALAWRQATLNPSVSSLWGAR